MNKEDPLKMFARLAGEVENAPPADVLALGHMMREWLQSVVADGGTHVDSGAGMGCFDLWLEMGGKQVFIQIRER